MAVEERPVERGELYLGRRDLPDRTAAQITAVTRIDHRRWVPPDGPVTTRLRSLFFDVVRGRRPKYRTCGHAGGVSQQRRSLTAAVGKLRAARRPNLGTRLAGRVGEGVSMFVWGTRYRPVHRYTDQTGQMGTPCRERRQEEMRPCLESESHVNERMHFVTRLERGER